MTTMTTNGRTAVRTVVTTALDIVGVLLIAACLYFVWPPAALAVFGVACLVGSWQHATPPTVDDDDSELL